MHCVHFDNSFSGWRKAAREMLQCKMPPHQISWLGTGDAGGLFDQAEAQAPQIQPGSVARVPRQLLEFLESAARFRVHDRWSLLYRILWRVAQGDHAAMLPGDIDGSELHTRLKAVRREAHHMHAFLRFQPRDLALGAPQFVAWHEPAHDILQSASEHFAERMGRHSWLIATPDDGMYWDGQRMQYQQPCPPHWQQLARAQDDDQGEALWLAYYGSTFNPARLNRSVMETNLPVRFWKNLPEGPLIPRLMSQARAGAQRDGQAEAVARQTGKSIKYQAPARTAGDKVSENADPDLPR
ncbi:TIGR03915 family putative DNA repair protein [Pseudomonas borbori]